MDADGRGFRFIASVERLPAAAYEVTLHSGLDGFHSFFGNLDGDRDGVPGGDYHHRFTPGGTARLQIEVPEFTPTGQPGAAVTLALPVYLTSGGDVRSLSIELKNDPQVLAISHASLGDALPSGARIDVAPAAGDLVKLTITSPEALPAGRHLVAHLHGQVAVQAVHQTAHPVPPVGVSPTGAPPVHWDGAFTAFALTGGASFGGAARANAPNGAKRRAWQKDFVAGPVPGATGPATDDPNRDLKIQLN
jgi:hypothetical protein